MKSLEQQAVDGVIALEQRRSDLRLRCWRLWEFLQAYPMMPTDADSYFAEIEEAESEIADITKELGYE